MKHSGSAEDSDCPEMRCLPIVLLLVAVLLISEADARRGWLKKAWKKAKPYLKTIAIHALTHGRRNADINADGMIDNSELAKITSDARTARELMEYIDENGDSMLNPEELNRSLRELEMIQEEDDTDDLDEMYAE